MVNDLQLGMLRTCAFQLKAMQVTFKRRFKNAHQEVKDEMMFLDSVIETLDYLIKGASDENA